ncbi:MAG: hypothetical protein ACTIKR_04320 [Advenella sp.]|uniref:hypothetical protein n=1 Tax=unclassified Advenella TaxID=2685285 RepID=UPI0018672D16|nr:hypothetical protein [Advenella sp. FME57]
MTKRSDCAVALLSVYRGMVGHRAGDAHYASGFVDPALNNEVHTLLSGHQPVIETL